MILLLGGTSEAGTIAAALAAAGVRVLVSTATDLSSSVRLTRSVAVRTGPLDEAGLHALIVAVRAQAVVDATHPYASAATRNAQQAADRAGVPYLRYQRPPAAGARNGVVCAGDHEEAARRAFLFGRPVLLTIGTRHLAPYLRESVSTFVPVVARVLSTPEALQACAAAGLPNERVVAGRGPFSVLQNVEVIRHYGIGVLVTKDGGTAGGVPEKLEAARREGCEIVVVARPEEKLETGCVFTGIGALVAACVAAAASGSTAPRHS